MYLVLILVFIATLFIYIKRKYFTLYGSIPGQSPHMFVGNLVQGGFLSDKYYGELLKNYQDRYGDTFQIWLGHLHAIVVCNPEDVKHIFNHRHIYEQGDVHASQHRLVFSDALICNTGHKYKRHASIILPLFRRGKILNNNDLILDCTDELLNLWRPKFEANSAFIHKNIVDQCQNLSLAIFGFLGFDFDLQILEESKMTQRNELSEALNTFLEMLIETTRLPNSISKLYLALSSRYQRARRTIEKYLTTIIEQELQKSPDELSNEKRKSLITSLVSSLQKDETAEAAKPEEEKRGLSRSEIVDELLLFLVAGSETTGTALAWFIHLMSKHPHIQAKIKAELGQNKNQRLTAEQLESLTYLDCVMREVLRFIPPVLCTARTTTVDDTLPGSGIRLEKGSEIFIPFYSLARDKRCWKIDPFQFYPERFEGADKDHPQFAWIPFGAGHRQCVGQDLARFELKAIAARLMQHVTFGDGGPDVNQGGFYQRLTTIPKNIGVTITFD